MARGSDGRWVLYIGSVGRGRWPVVCTSGAASWGVRVGEACIVVGSDTDGGLGVRVA